MSERDWKPGDVAAVRFAWGMGEYRTCLRGQRYGRWGWFHSVLDGFTADDHPAGPTDVRPLVVIDPEDSDDRERLLTLLQGMSFAAHACGALTCLHAALREFANPTPPKPEEPTGLGAVVEDSEGRRYVRCDWSPDSRWHCSDDDTGNYDDLWRDIKATRVLSEGVQP